MKTIVITGGSGFLGRRLSYFFIKKNYKIIHLSKSGKKINNIEVFRWDPEKKYISDEAKKVLQESDAIINLAGANIAGKIWDENYKNEIIKSRVDSVSFLCELLNNNKNHKRPEVAIFASAIGYYGNRGSEILDEKSPPGKGFLAETCEIWEQSSINLHPDIRKAHIRIGFVLDKEEGGFPKMIMPLKFFVGSILGNGKQYISWIHIEDLIRIFEFVLENPNAKGVYNGTAPSPVTLEEILKKSAKLLTKPILLPNIPEFLIKTILGEMSELFLNSSYVIPQKLIEENFKFHYEKIDDALKNLLLPN